MSAVRELDLAQVNARWGRDAPALVEWAVGLGQPTIVTTNITDGALLEKLYTEKISSRLSSFVPFLFMGDDIRAQKAEEA